MKNYQMPEAKLIPVNGTDILRTSGEAGYAGDPYISAPDYWVIDSDS